MKKYLTHKVLTLFIGLLMLISTCLFTFPVKAENKPKPSQINLKIIVSDQQAPAVIGVIDDFLADPLGSGVNNVEVVASGTRADDQLTFLIQQMLIESSEFDVIGLDTIWLSQFSENNWVERIDSRLDPDELNNYVDSIVYSCKYKGIPYAYPYFMNLGILYYRKDIIEEYGFSEADFDTWEELNVTANYILNNVSGKLKNSDLVGYVCQLDVYEGGVVNFFEWASSFGATDLITSEGIIDINNVNVKKAMEFIQALIPPQYTGVQGTPYIIPRSGLVDDEGSSVSRWLTGNSIFMRQWTFAYMESINNGISFGVIPLPTATGAADEKSSCIGGSILTISKFSQNKDAAWNLTRFLGDTLAQEFELTSVSNFPALKSVYDNPPTGFEWIKNWKNQLNKTFARPAHPKYALISSVIADNFNDILSNIKDVDTALKEMEDDILDIVSEQPPETFVFYIVVIVIAIIAISIVIGVYIKKTIKKPY